MYGMFDEHAYLRELQKKKNLIPYEQSITDPYYAQLALKQEPQIAGEPDIADLNAIRSLVRADISKYIKTADQVSFAVEELDRSNDLVNFYRFNKAFDTSIKGVRGLDASFFLQLWDKFKSNVLAAKRVIPVEQQPVAYQPTEAQYREGINRANMVKEDVKRNFEVFKPQLDYHPSPEVKAAAYKQHRRKTNKPPKLVKPRKSSEYADEMKDIMFPTGLSLIADNDNTFSNLNKAAKRQKDTYTKLMNAINNQERQDQIENAMAEKIQRNYVNSQNNKKIRKVFKAIKDNSTAEQSIKIPQQLPYQHVPVPHHFGFEIPDQPIAVSPGLPLRTMTAARNAALKAAKRANKTARNREIKQMTLNDIDAMATPSTRARGRPLGAKTTPKPRITVGGALKKKPVKRAKKKLSKIHFV